MPVPVNEIIRAALSPKQAELGDLLLEGLTNQQMAERLSVSLHTVKRRIHNLCVLFKAGEENFEVFGPHGYRMGKANRILLARRLMGE